MKVINATLHQPVPLKGGISSDKTLNDTKIRGLEMDLMPQGLMVCVPDKQIKGKMHKTLVPLPNVAAMSLADEPEEKKKPLK